jgi:hypothetical protein
MFVHFNLTELFSAQILLHLSLCLAYYFPFYSFSPYIHLQS